MGTKTVQGGEGQGAVTNRSALFLASCIALIATAMAFGIRGEIMRSLEIDFALDKTQLGWINLMAFWGFTVSIFIGAQLCDWLGMKRILWLAFIGHVVGSFATIFAPGFWMLFFATLAVGLANGFVEAAINPLVATIYPEQKTQKLNALHAWFPGGIVIGGLVAYALNFAFHIPGNPADAARATLHLSWQVKVAALLLPTLIYGIMLIGMRLPATERVQSGVSTKAMYKEALKPLFLVWLFCMLLTAATELGPNQWISNIMASTAGTGILVLVWISVVMAIGRMFAGPIMHGKSPISLLIVSAILGAIGLYWLGHVETKIAAYAAATVFAIGVCYFWPTMLGVTAERFPKGGALLLGLMGAAGMFSAGVAQPLMGKINDYYTAKALPAGESLKTLIEQVSRNVPGADKILAPAQAVGGAMTLRWVAVLPVVLVVIFAAIYLRDKARGGYRIEKLTDEDVEKAMEQPVG